MSSYDMYLSYTGFKKYVSCPQQYKLEYIDRKRPDVEDQRNTLNGNALHNLLEEYIERGVNDTSYFTENIDRVWQETLEGCDHVVWRHDDDSANLQKKARGWAENLGSMFDTHKFDVEQCEPELKADTVVDINGIRLKMAGRLDVVWKTRYNDYMVFDLKASENRAVMDFDQLVWYSIVLSEYLKDPEQPKRVGYILPGFNEIPVYEVPQEAKDKLVARLYQVLTNIQRGHFPAKPEDQKCFWCSVKFACPAKGQLVGQSGGMVYMG